MLSAAFQGGVGGGNTKCGSVVATAAAHFAGREIRHSDADRESSEGLGKIKYLWLLSITTKTPCHQSL